MQPALKKNQALKENVTRLFKRRVCLKMTTDGLVSESLFDSCSLYFVLLLTRKERGVCSGERAEGRLGIAGGFAPACRHLRQKPASLDRPEEILPRVQVKNWSFSYKFHS